jgi:hypothetical protein
VGTEPRAGLNEAFFRQVFLAASIYDVVLGLVFFIFYGPIFAALGIPLPPNTSYIHLTAGFVFVQGIGYWFVYREPRRNVDLARLGIVYKAVYSAIALYYFAIDQLLSVAFLLFAIFDLAFLVLFIIFVRAVTSEQVAAR